MELILQRGLPHQQKAVDAVSAALNGVQIASPVQFYENPSISLSDSRLSTLHKMHLPFCCHAETEPIYANKTVVKTRRFSVVPSERSTLPGSAVAAIKRAPVKL